MLNGVGNYAAAPNELQFLAAVSFTAGSITAHCWVGALVPNIELYSMKIGLNLDFK